MAESRSPLETSSFIVPAEYPSSAAFLESWDDGGSLIVPAAVAVHAGQKVALVIRVADHPGRVVVRGNVSPFRPSDGRGFVLKVRDADAGRLQRAAAFLKGEGGPAREERLDVDDVPVGYLLAGALHEGRVRDVSTGGCFVVTPGPLPKAGSHLALEVKPAGSLFRKLRLQASVTWVDEDEATRGFGVHFEQGQGAQVEKFFYHVLVED